MNLSPNSEKSPDFTSSDTTENSNLSNDLKPSKRLFRFYVLIARDETNLAILISVFFLFIILILRVQLSVSYHPDISGSERSSIMPIQYLVNNLPLYVDPNEPPFYIVQYTPIYFYLVALPYKLFFDPGNVHAIYAASRLVSLLLVLVATLVFFRCSITDFAFQKMLVFCLPAFFWGFVVTGIYTFQELIACYWSVLVSLFMLLPSGTNPVTKKIPIYYLL
jgi:hypothetical protein